MTTTANEPVEDQPAVGADLDDEPIEREPEGYDDRQLDAPREAVIERKQGDDSDQG